MKKIITRVLALCLAVMMLMTCASAAYNARQINQADALNYLGLFLGTGKGYSLEAPLNRSQSITLILRMLGEAAEAEKGGYQHPFKDVPQWADKYVAYAYEKGYVKGYNDTTFGGADTVTDYQYLTMVLRALGYTDSGDTPDFNYRKSAVLAKELGLVSSTADDASFVRGNAVEIFWNAMRVKIKNSNETLSERLIAQNVFTQEQFETASDYAVNGKPADSKTDDTAGDKKDDKTDDKSDDKKDDGKPDSGEKKPEDYTWEEYQAMSGAEREAHFKQFSSPEAYIQWLNKAKADYDKEHPTIEVGADGTIDLGKLTGKS